MHLVLLFAKMAWGYQNVYPDRWRVLVGIGRFYNRVIFMRCNCVLHFQSDTGKGVWCWPISDWLIRLIRKTLAAGCQATNRNIGKTLLNEPAASALPLRQRAREFQVRPVGYGAWLGALISVFLCGLNGCINRQADEVVVLSALDREFAALVLEDVQADLKIPLRIKYDVESNKTVGLTNEIIRNQRRPRADLFWNNEILHTIRLEKLGLLEPVDATRRPRFPERFVSPSGHWFGFAARARVLIVNTDLMPDADQRPTSFSDLASVKFRGKCTLARPLFGTSATHAAVMFDVLGETEAVELYQRISDNAIVQGGNKPVAEKVAAGEFLFGLTDTDDALVELDAGRPVAIVFPDQDDDKLGALLIPNTLCVLKNGPNTNGAVRLLKRLLEADVEVRLANGRSAQIPLASDVEAKSRVVPEALKVMEADFESAAEGWETAAANLKKIFPLGN